MIKTYQIFVKGWVQGVNFRYYTLQEARRNNIKGYVRNLADGRVEVLAIGKESQLKQLMEFLGKGPSLASVEELEVKEISKPAHFSEFMIKY